jgi:hypothetical protein
MSERDCGSIDCVNRCDGGHDYADCPGVLRGSGEPAATPLLSALAKGAFLMSEPNLSGHRVIIGFNTMQDAADAHDALAQALRRFKPSSQDTK